MITDSSCPCGSGKTLAQCCLPIIQGRQAAGSAEALMRSRYSAFVLGDADYLLSSWDTQTRPGELELDDQSAKWCGLKILHAMDDSVNFVAYFTENNQSYVLQEKSRFRQQDGQWRYVDGENQVLGPLSRNAACPCGSGKKFKRCCAQ